MAQRRTQGLSPCNAAVLGGCLAGVPPAARAGRPRDSRRDGGATFLSAGSAQTGACSLTIAGMQTSGQTGTRMIRDWKQWEGQTVNGTFLLRQYLGGSAHSAVFLTERRGREPQRAVIKLIPADPATAGVQLSRWEATAKLSHPHLLRLFESGSCQLDKVVLLYVVMEYAEDNLAQILPHRALTPAEVRDLLEPALDALTFIHGKGLVHSRLKPSNVLAAQDQLKLSSDSLLRTGETAGLIAPAQRVRRARGRERPNPSRIRRLVIGYDGDGSAHPALARLRRDRGAFTGDGAGAVHGNRPLLFAPRSPAPLHGGGYRYTAAVRAIEFAAAFNGQDTGGVREVAQHSSCRGCGISGGCCMARSQAAEPASRHSASEFYFLYASGFVCAGGFA